MAESSLNEDQEFFSCLMFATFRGPTNGKLPAISESGGLDQSNESQNLKVHLHDGMEETNCFSQPF